jgi:hypothetical protein
MWDCALNYADWVKNCVQGRSKLVSPAEGSGLLGLKAFQSDPKTSDKARLVWGNNPAALLCQGTFSL